MQKLRVNTPPPYQRSMTVNSIELVPTGTAGIKAELASPKPAAASHMSAPPATSLGFGVSAAMNATASRARELLEHRRVKAKMIAASVPPPELTLNPEGHHVMPKVASQLQCLPPPAKSSKPESCASVPPPASKTALKAPPAKHISWSEPAVKSSFPIAAANVDPSQERDLAVPNSMGPAESALAVPNVSPARSALAVAKVSPHGSAVAVPKASPATSAVAVPKVSPAGSAIAVPKVSPPASKVSANQQASKGNKAENAELSKAIGKVHVLGNEVACLILCWILHGLFCLHDILYEAAIWPETYEERQSLYATFKRPGTDGMNIDL